MILQTGETLPGVKARRGGFFEMFGRELRKGAAPQAVDVTLVDITEKREDDPLPDLALTDGLLMTGSPAMVGEDAAWMRWGCRVINAAVDELVPFLGVCFGHQLLGVARGADVGPNHRGREIGSVEVSAFGTKGDRLLDGLPESFLAQVSHVDVIRDPGDKLEVLGRAPHDTSHIVRAGPWAWGVQFHPEFDEDIVLEYLRARHPLVDADHGQGAADLRIERVGPSPEALEVLHRFVRVCARRRAEREALLEEEQQHAG